MEENKIVVRNIAQLVTCSGFKAKAGRHMAELDIIEDGAVSIENGVITHVGTTAGVLRQINQEEFLEIDATGKAVLPGFVDSHTHFVFDGYREEEFCRRLQGDSYMSIMEQGGGILNTVQATRESSMEQLWRQGMDRLDEMFRMGVTTVEGKSGYGLDMETEMKQLRVMANLNASHPVSVVSTFLGAHAVPPEFEGRANAYIEYLSQVVLPAVWKERLAKFCDVFCEKGVFTVEQSNRLLRAARKIGFRLKIHADELSTFGGAELAARLETVSADHLLHASVDGIKLLARKGIVTTLLPLTAFSLGEPYANGRKMIDRGCAVALASDLNPGSCFSASIPMLFSLACIYMGMKPEEVVTALTINGAAALGMADKIGSITVGKRADMVLLKYPSYKFLPYNVGTNVVDAVIKNGVLYEF